MIPKSLLLALLAAIVCTSAARAGMLFAYFGLTKEDYELTADVVGYRLLFLAKDAGNPVQQVLVGEIIGGQLAISTTTQMSKLVGPVTGGQVGPILRISRERRSARPSSSRRMEP